MTILYGVLSIYTVLTNLEKESSQQALTLIHKGSMFASLLFVLLLAKLKLKLADYAVFFILAVRSLETYLVFHMIDTSALGFELIDKKELMGAISFIAIPAQILTICNLRFNFIITTPLTILSIMLVEQRAYTTNGDNMSCFKTPAKFVGLMNSRSYLLIFLLIVIGYMYRKTTLERFIE